MVPRRHNARGFTELLRPCVPSLSPPQGPDVRLPKILTFRRGDAAARAVIGTLTKTVAKPKPDAKTETGSRLRCCVDVEPQLSL